MSHGLVFIRSKCIGCRICEAACRSVDEDAGFRARVMAAPRDEGLSYVLIACVQCEEPACVEACPTEPKSLYRHGDGVVTVDRGRCIACGYCSAACPYAAIHVSPSSAYAVKCDLCRGRLEEGEQPACVEKCPTGALKVGRVSRRGIAFFIHAPGDGREKKHDRFPLKS
jgi:Fe-S-cluster-containing dehydrogenase component